MSPQNATVHDLYKQLEERNSMEAHRRWPVILFISILMCFGTFGNMNVLYIYVFRYKKSTYRLFVVSLAVIDLVACMVSMPFEIADELHPYDFFDDSSCKIFRFINISVGSISALMLVLIASERYRKICISQAPEMSEYSVKKLTLALTCVSVIVSSPALHVYGNKTITIPGLAINGSECTWGDHMEGSVFGYVFYGYASLIIVTCMITMSVLYSMVGCHLKKHAHNMRRTLRKRYRCAVNSEVSSNKVTGNLKTEMESCLPCPDIQDDQHSFRIEITIDNEDKTETMACKVREEDHNKNQDELLEKNNKDETKAMINNTNRNPQHENPQMKTLQSGNQQSVNPQIGNPPRRKQSQISVESSTLANTTLKRSRTEKETKITKVLFTITLLFILTYLPYIIILVVYGLDSQYEQTLSPSVHNLYLIGLRMYLINNAANCILYNYFDKKFRKITKDIYMGMFHRLKCF